MNQIIVVFAHGAAAIGTDFRNDPWLRSRA